jgi:hypothetical protein
MGICEGIENTWRGKSYTNKSHLSELTSSVRESIEILKREVGVNEKK